MRDSVPSSSEVAQQLSTSLSATTKNANFPSCTVWYISALDPISSRNSRGNLIIGYAAMVSNFERLFCAYRWVAYFSERIVSA